MLFQNRLWALFWLSTCEQLDPRANRKSIGNQQETKGPRKAKDPERRGTQKGEGFRKVRDLERPRKVRDLERRGTQKGEG